MAIVPKKFLSRRDEITEDFLKLADQHMNDVLHNQVDRMFHSSDFAKLLFIHPRHLTNTIKLTTGKSPCDVIEEKVMTESQRMLRETDKSVTEIAASFFYFEPSNFIKFFKGMCGLTPLQYRKRMTVVNIQ